MPFVKRHETDLDQFNSFYMPEPNTGCWLWIGGVDQRGYGHIKDITTRRTVSAHRRSYLLFKGIVPPPGMFVLHRCDQPCCVNPDHLFLGTHQDNMADMAKKGRSHTRPHNLTPDEIAGVMTDSLQMKNREVREKYKIHSWTVKKYKRLAIEALTPRAPL